MVTSLIVLLIGLGILYYGAEFLVDGASKIALSFGISPMIIGLTIVALATSAPEFVVSLLAALGGSPDIAVGNIIGSNIANVALIVGAAAALFPMAVEGSVLKRDYPVMMIAFVLMITVAWIASDIDRIDGALLLILLTVFLTLCVRVAVRQNREFRLTGQMAAIDPADRSVWRNVTKVVGGLIALVVGAKLMVDNAVEIARQLEVPELIIGVTIIALGTSLPELATSVIAALRKEPDISLGNILGSNIFNTGLIVGGVAVIHPISVSEQALRFDLPAMFLIGALLFPLMRMNYRISRADGVLLLAVYAAYIVGSVLFSMGRIGW